MPDWNSDIFLTLSKKYPVLWKDPLVQETAGVISSLLGYAEYKGEYASEEDVLHLDILEKAGCLDAKALALTMINTASDGKGYMGDRGYDYFSAPVKRMMDTIRKKPAAHGDLIEGDETVAKNNIAGLIGKYANAKEMADEGGGFLSFGGDIELMMGMDVFLSLSEHMLLTGKGKEFPPALMEKYLETADMVTEAFSEMDKGGIRGDIEGVIQDAKNSAKSLRIALGLVRNEPSAARPKNGSFTL